MSCDLLRFLALGTVFSAYARLKLPVPTPTTGWSTAILDPVADQPGAVAGDRVEAGSGLVEQLVADLRGGEARGDQDDR